MANKGKVLVVDDEQVVRDFLVAVFGRFGYDVHTAENGCEALEIALAEELIGTVTDKDMPNGDGLTFIKRYKEKRPDAYVLIASGNWSTEERSEAERIVGAEHVLDKPYSVADLRKMMDAESSRRSL